MCNWRTGQHCRQVRFLHVILFIGKTGKYWRLLIVIFLMLQFIKLCKWYAHRFTTLILGESGLAGTLPLSRDLVVFLHLYAQCMHEMLKICRKLSVPFSPEKQNWSGLRFRNSQTSEVLAFPYCFDVACIKGIGVVILSVVIAVIWA